MAETQQIEREIRPRKRKSDLSGSMIQSLQPKLNLNKQAIQENEELINNEYNQINALEAQERPNLGKIGPSNSSRQLISVKSDVQGGNGHSNTGIKRIGHVKKNFTSSEKSLTSKTKARKLSSVDKVDIQGSPQSGKKFRGRPKKKITKLVGDSNLNQQEESSQNDSQKTVLLAQISHQISLQKDFSKVVSSTKGDTDEKGSQSKEPIHDATHESILKQETCDPQSQLRNQSPPQNFKPYQQEEFKVNMNQHIQQSVFKQSQQMMTQGVLPQCFNNTYMTQNPYQYMAPPNMVTQQQAFINQTPDMFPSMQRSSSFFQESSQDQSRFNILKQQGIDSQFQTGFSSQNNHIYHDHSFAGQMIFNDISLSNSPKHHHHQRAIIDQDNNIEQIIGKQLS